MNKKYCQHINNKSELTWFTNISGEGRFDVCLQCHISINHKDMENLEKAFFQNLQRDDCEYGGIGIDCKRPFGNSDVEGDILELIGAKPEGDDGEDECWSSRQRHYAATLYDNLIRWLQGRYL